MSRILVPRLGGPVQRALLMDKFDEAVTSVMRVLNGGLDAGNVKRGVKFGVANSGDVQYAWLEPASICILRGTTKRAKPATQSEENKVLLGATPDSAGWASGVVVGKIVAASASLSYRAKPASEPTLVTVSIEGGVALGTFFVSALANHEKYGREGFLYHGSNDAGQGGTPFPGTVANATLLNATWNGSTFGTSVINDDDSTLDNECTVSVAIRYLHQVA